MAIYVYNISDGSLHSWCPSDDDPVADDATLEAQGMDKVSGLPPLDDTHVWDAGQTTVVEIAAPVKPNEIPTDKFVLLFTPTEYDNIISTRDKAVAHFWAAVQSAAGSTIDLNNPKTQKGVNQMVTARILTQEAADAILAGEERPY